MNVLLDTCTFLWIATDSASLSPRAREVFRDPMNAIHLSAVSAWQIAVKFGRGGLRLADPPERLIPAAREKYGIEGLPLDEESVLQAHRLPALHRDPFDRMLVCQAIVHGLAILTPDHLIGQYTVRTLW